MAEVPISLSAYIPEKYQGLRLDQALSLLFPAYSRSRLQEWIQHAWVKVDGNTVRSKDKVRAGQSIEINASLTIQTPWEGQALPLNIVYEDEALLVIHKPAGQVVHPGAGNRENTLVNALLHYDEALKKVPRGGIVHRLDKDTSGLLVVGRTLLAHTQLVEQIQARQVVREYITIVQGTFTGGGTIDAPIGRDPHHRLKQAVTSSGKPAVTHYRLQERLGAYTLLKVKLETGRTHQIRVHMLHIGHPILGDPLYHTRQKWPAGVSEAFITALRSFNRQALHAHRLGLRHPMTGEYLEWHVPIPEDMNHMLTLLRTQ